MITIPIMIVDKLLKNNFIRMFKSTDDVGDSFFAVQFVYRLVNETIETGCGITYDSVTSFRWATLRQHPCFKSSTNPVVYSMCSQSPVVVKPPQTERQGSHY